MLVIQSIKIFWVGTRITQLLNTWTDDNSLKTFTLQNEAASSDGQDSGEEAELKRKKIEMQKVSVEWEEMEVTVVKYVLYLMNVLVSLNITLFNIKIYTKNTTVQIKN